MQVFPFLMDTLVQSRLYIHCIYQYVYDILKKKNTNTKFRTCDVAGRNGSACTGVGELMACMSFIIYLIFICITAFFLRSVKLWVPLLFVTYVCYDFCTSEIECNSDAGHLR